MEKRTLPLVSETHRKFAASFCLEAEDGWLVTFSPPNRSLEQNARMWSLLTDVSEQVEWRDWQGDTIHMTPDEWKDFFFATFTKEQRMVLGDDGRSLVLVGSGGRTSKMGVKRMAEFQTFIEAFGLQRGVVFKALSKDNVEQLEAYRR